MEGGAWLFHTKQGGTLKFFEASSLFCSWKGMLALSPHGVQFPQALDQVRKRQIFNQDFSETLLVTSVNIMAHDKILPLRISPSEGF